MKLFLVRQNPHQQACTAGTKQELSWIFVHKDKQINQDTPIFPRYFLSGVAVLLKFRGEAMALIAPPLYLPSKVSTLSSSELCQARASHLLK